MAAAMSSKMINVLKGYQGLTVVQSFDTSDSTIGVLHTRAVKVMSIVR
jgi:hypothetical protein